MKQNNFYARANHVFFMAMMIIFCVCAAKGNAQGTSPASAMTVDSIEIRGLKRTKESYIMESLERFKGMKDAEQAAKGVEAALNAQGLFSEVSVEAVPSGGGAKIVATVKEKVSFLPLPIGGGSSDGWMAGLMLMDMNAFGVHDIFTGGFIFGNEMQFAMLSYTKIPKGLLRPGFSVSGGFVNSDDKDYTDWNNNTFAEDDTIGAFGNMLVILPLSRHFTASLGGEYAFRHYDDGTWDTGHLLMGKAALSWRTSHGGDWFPIESSVGLQGKAGGDLGNGGKAAQEASLKGHFQCPFTGRGRLDLGFNGILQRDMPYPFQTGKRDVLSSIAVPDFQSDRYGAARLLCEIGLFRGKYAMLSLYGQFEAAAAKNTDDSFVWCTGPGAGVLLYLNRIIFPSIMGGFTYNINQNRVQGSFSVGMNF